MPTLDVTIVQAELHWHDAARNRDHFARTIHEIEGHSDLIILPEMFTTGFSMDAPALAEAMDGETVAWMMEMAGRNSGDRA